MAVKINDIYYSVVLLVNVELNNIHCGFDSETETVLIVKEKPLFLPSQHDDGYEEQYSVNVHSPAAIINIGMLCCVQLGSDWFRAEIKQVLSNGELHLLPCFFVSLD